MSSEVKQIKVDEEKRLGKSRLGIWRGLLILVFLLVGIAGSSGCLFFQGSLFGGNDTAQVEPYQYTAEQADLVQEMGNPEAFILLFYEEEAEFGSLQTVRQETWEYYSTGVSYLFINGELVSTERLDIEQLGSLVPLPYSPEQFSAHMSRDDVLAAAGVDDFIEVPLEKEYLESGDLYYAESLSFGLVDGELRYLEALALVEE